MCPAEFYCVNLFRPSLVREDQGGCAGALRCGKGTNWEGGQRVPALVSYPGKISPGKSHILASTLDIFPTIASIIKNSAGHNNADIGRMSNEDVGYDLTRSLLKDEQVNNCTNIHNSFTNLCRDHIKIFICIYFFLFQGPRKTFLYYPDGPTLEKGPFAVRYRHYKAHFYTQGRC